MPLETDVANHLIGQLRGTDAEGNQPWIVADAQLSQTSKLTSNLPVFVSYCSGVIIGRKKSRGHLGVATAS